MPMHNILWELQLVKYLKYCFNSSHICMYFYKFEFGQRLAKYLKSNVLQKFLHGEMAVCYKLKHSNGHSKHLYFNINLAIHTVI